MGVMKKTVKWSAGSEKSLKKHSCVFKNALVWQKGGISTGEKSLAQQTTGNRQSDLRACKALHSSGHRPQQHSAAGRSVAEAAAAAVNQHPEHSEHPELGEEGVNCTGSSDCQRLGIKRENHQQKNMSVF